MTLSDIFRKIGKDCYWYYCPETKEVNTFQYFSRQDCCDGNMILKQEIGTGISSELIRLPEYKDIDHKDIMSFYVKECVEDKGPRRKLFNILRNHDFMDRFLDTVKELNLYDEYLMVTDDIYIQLADEWIEKNNIIPDKQNNKD
jgi:hypothetical protein